MSLCCCYLQDLSSANFWPRFTAFYFLFPSPADRTVYKEKKKNKNNNKKNSSTLLLEMQTPESAIENVNYYFSKIYHNEITFFFFLFLLYKPGKAPRRNIHVISYLTLDYSASENIQFFIFQILTHVISEITVSFKL